VINNAGNPVKQYEPYFSINPDYEHAPQLVETGISSILFYDAAGRQVCKLNPNQTYEKTVFDAWKVQNWDANDTLFILSETGDKITDISQDPDVGHYFAALAGSEDEPSWYQTRINGGLGAEQQQAAQRSESHAGTPSEAHHDALGRPVYALAHNGWDDNGLLVQYQTRTELDIEGNILSVNDDRGNRVMAYRYNMLPPNDEETPKPVLYQDSMDGGEKWTLFDIQGKALKSWDSRDHVFENEYDQLNRQVKSWVTEAGVRKLVGLTEYVDSDHGDADPLREMNLIGSAVRSYDQAGRSEILGMDFKGNLLSATRTLTSDYQQTIDWQTNPDSQLEEEVFVTTTTYDALNRVTLAQSPHHQTIPASTTRPTYNESGALDQMHVAIRGGAEQVYVEKIEYDAKAQRQLIEYGNGVSTRYEYEPDTYRLSRLLTEKSNGSRLQDLHYCYDPVGNICSIRDEAQSTVYFNNAQVDPNSEYWYDPLYRLIKATGREHATQANIPSSATGWQGLQSNNDLSLQRYLQTYQYDGVGNVLEMAHRRPNDNNTGWTRAYQYESENNRLLATTLGDPDQPFDEIYAYNAHGSITRMPHLPTMSWDYAEQLRHVNLQGGGDAYYVYDLDGQRIRKVIETNGTTVKERIYLGAWEIYRVSNVSGIQLERESLHIMDEQNRIGLVETKTIGESNQEGLLPIARYQISDHLGSASMELDDVGEMISYEEYHPYGTTAYHAGSGLINVSQKRYRYTGKERDEESGFSYHEARYYSNVINRWLTPDPAGVSGGQNLYAYVLGNPINLIDEHGMAPTPPKLNSNQQQQVSQVMKGQINFAHIVVDQGKNAHLVVMNPSGVSVAHRTSKETYTQMGLRQDNSKAVDVTVTGIVLDELPWATDVGVVNPKIMDPKKGIKLGGFVVENGIQSGRTSEQGFSFSATNELSESSRMYQELGMPLPLQQSSTSLGWEFKQGNPNPKSIVGVGGLAPVIIGGIPYGKGNLYSGKAPPDGPR